MTAFQWANTIEACVWPTIGAVVAVIGRKRGMSRGEVIVAVVTLTIFGVSDLVETQTGAWYKPWWLLLWKALCVATLLAVLIKATRRK